MHRASGIADVSRGALAAVAAGIARVAGAVVQSAVAHAVSRAGVVPCAVHAEGVGVVVGLALVAPCPIVPL